jgi:hypothetical protein
VHVKSLQSHYTRALLTSRKVMQRRCIDLENEIRGILKVFGVKLPMRLILSRFLKFTLAHVADVAEVLLPPNRDGP